MELEKELIRSDILLDLTSRLSTTAYCNGSGALLVRIGFGPTSLEATSLACNETSRSTTMKVLT